MNVIRSKKKFYVISVAALLVIALLCWRFFPRSLGQIAFIDEELITGLYCNVTISGMDDGEAFYDVYELKADHVDSEDFRTIMEIVSNCKYRPDYRNLWPRKRTSADAAGTYTGVGSIINLYVGDQKYMLEFLSSDVVITYVENGYLTFHTTDKEALDKLASYMKAHGEKKKF